MELWFLSGDLHYSDESSPTTIIRMVKELFCQRLIYSPPGIVLAEAVQYSPPLASKNCCFKMVLCIIDTTGLVTAQEIRYLAERVYVKPIGYNQNARNGASAIKMKLALKIGENPS
ncbi:MAG: hypothetical protein EZS28_036707, partial [Streblomastix strix]